MGGRLSDSAECVDSSVAVMVYAAVALYLTVNCAEMNIQVLSYDFFAHFVLEGHFYVVSLLRG